MSKERIGIHITREVVFGEKLLTSININAPLNKETIAMITNLIENTVESVSNWKGSGGERD